MKIFFRFLLTLFCMFSCKGQTAKEKISFIELAINSYEFKHLKNDGLPVMNYVLNESINDSIEYKRLTLPNKITKFSANLIWNQIKITSEDIKSKKIISAKQIENWYSLRYVGFWKKFKKEYGNSGFYKVSRPFYSDDKKSVLILLEVSYFKSSTDYFWLVFDEIKGVWQLNNNDSLF